MSNAKKLLLNILIGFNIVICIALCYNIKTIYEHNKEVDRVLEQYENLDSLKKEKLKEKMSNA